MIEEATEIDLPRAWPCTIYDGFLELNGAVHNNVIPIPLVHEGRVKLKLDIADDDDHFISIEIAGSSARLTLLGEARFVEEFRSKA